MEESQELRGEYTQHTAERHVQSDFIYLMFKICKTKECTFRNKCKHGKTIKMSLTFVCWGWEWNGEGYTGGFKDSS